MNISITSGALSTLVEIDGKKAYYQAGEMRPYVVNTTPRLVYLYDLTDMLEFGKDRIILDLDSDIIDVDGVSVFADADALFAALEPVFFLAKKLRNRVIVNQDNYEVTLGNNPDATKEYFIDGIIDVGLTHIHVPAGGLLITGYGFNRSKLISTEANFTLFQGAAVGDVFLKSLTIGISGTNSGVFALFGDTGNEAIEMREVQFIGCTSLGYLEGFRQGIELHTNRFGGTPELEFRGTWLGGYKVITSIAMGFSNLSALFKAGIGFNYQGRFILTLNCDLPAIGALCDFTDANIADDESLLFVDCYVRREGVIDPEDTAIVPNIDERNTKSLWNNNVGLKDTQKFYRQVITTEVTTVINTAGTYEVLAGTWTGDVNPSHFDSPVNGQVRLLSGGGKFQIFGNLSITGVANGVVDIRLVKSSDNGVTWPEVVNHSRRQINSLVGLRDVAFFDFGFLTDLAKNDRLRLEVENVYDTFDLTAELDSGLIITAE